jgi:ribosomal-protein-alanine N-acetyltransferase
MADAQTAFDNWTSDPDVAKYVRWNTHETVNTTIEWIAHVEQGLSNDKCFDWCFVLKETGEIFGSGGVFWRNDVGLFELGYVIMKKHWNKGLTTEAARAIVDFAVCELKQTKLFTCYAIGNEASGRVMEKLGFVYQKDGEYSKFDGTIIPCREYLLTVQGSKCPSAPECPCPKTDCPNHGKCCSCVVKHRKGGNLPFCLRFIMEGSE